MPIVARICFVLTRPLNISMAVNVNLFPVTGVTLPLISMGGSSFLFTCLSIGIILSVSRNVEQLEGKRRMEAIAKKPADGDEVVEEEELEEAEA